MDNRYSETIELKVSRKILYDNIKEVGKNSGYMVVQGGIKEIWNVVDDQTRRDIGRSIKLEIQEKMWL